MYMLKYCPYNGLFPSLYACVEYTGMNGSEEIRLKQQKKKDKDNGLSRKENKIGNKVKIFKRNVTIETKSKKAG